MNDTKWGLVIAAMSLLLSMAVFVMNTMKDESSDVRELERRLCRLEALNNMGDCKR